MDLFIDPPKSFKDLHSYEKRKAEAERIIAKYPDRVPIIVEKKRSDIPDIDKNKFLVPNDLTVGQFLGVIRKRIKLPPEKAIFLLINNQLPPTNQLLSQTYQAHKADDLFLYIEYTGETTFGSS